MQQGKQLTDLAIITSYLKKGNFDQHFYVDYFGTAAICNGKRFGHDAIQIWSSFEAKNEKTNETIAYIYGLITNTGLKGVLKIYANTPNANQAKQFADKCVDSKGDL